MYHLPLLEEYLMILAAMCIVVPLFHRLHLSPILGYLVTGALIGPSGLGVISDTKSVDTLGDYGVVFLLFVIALEMPFSRLKVMRKIVFGLGLTQVVVTGFVLWLCTRFFFGVNTVSAFILASGLALSSTAIVLSSLLSRGEINNRLWRTSLGILLFQDLAIVPLLAMIPMINDMQLSWSVVLEALLQGTLALIIITVVGLVLVRPVLRAVAVGDQPELFTAFALLIVLGVGWITDQAGLSMALGGFLAGMLIAETEFRHQIRADVEPFRGILLSLFFMTIGMRIDPNFILQNLLTIFLCVLGLLLVKGMVLGGLCRLFGNSWALSLQVGLSLAQGGEFGFILFTLAAEQGLLTHEVTQLAMATISITLAFTPSLLILGRKGSQFFQPRSGKEKEDALQDIMQNLKKEAENIVLIAGFGRVGQIVARLMENYGMPYIAFDLNPRRVQEGRRIGLNVFYGDVSRYEVLEALKIHNVHTVVITIKHASALQRVVYILKQQFTNMKVIVRTRDDIHAKELKRIASDAVIIPEFIEGGLYFGGRVLSLLEVSNEEVTRLLQEYRASSYTKIVDIIEVRAKSVQHSQGPFKKRSFKK